VKFMTDGILLAEIASDRWLSAYDTVIIDEAHERSLNIDFLLGYLKQLLQRRRDLKVIVTSATIDTERFAAHFGGAPVVNVEGRGYPVEVRYRPLGSERGQSHFLPCQAGDPANHPQNVTLTPFPLSTASSPPATRSHANVQWATPWSSCPANARSATRTGRWSGASTATPKSCRCTRGCRRATRTACSIPARSGASCWRPTSRKPR